MISTNPARVSNPGRVENDLDKKKNGSTVTNVQKLKTEKLEPGHHYHIYNRGNNGGDLFFEQENYQHFLRLYNKYLNPVAETLAFCLMKNHFHFLLYLKEENEQRLADGLVQEQKEKVLDASRQLSHFFNSYAQAVNKRYNRTGSLFEKPFERKRIDSEDYLKKLIFYIHNNSVAHNFVEDLKNYRWSSYKTIVSREFAAVNRDRVLELFGGIENFIAYHKRE